MGNRPTGCDAVFCSKNKRTTKTGEEYKTPEVINHQRGSTRRRLDGHGYQPLNHKRDAMPIERLALHTRIIFLKTTIWIPAKDMVAELMHSRELFISRSQRASRQGSDGVVNPPHVIVYVLPVRKMAHREDAVHQVRPDRDSISSVIEFGQSKVSNQRALRTHIFYCLLEKENHLLHALDRRHTSDETNQRLGFRTQERVCSSIVYDHVLEAFVANR